MSFPTLVTVADQAPAVRALLALTGAFQAWPADVVSIGTVVHPGGVGQGIEIDLHTSFADFEMWREGLAIDPATVEHRELTTVQTLRAYAVFADVPVVLTAYSSKTR